MAPIRVEDPGDPRIAGYRNVPDPELLRQHGQFIAEGRLVVRRLLASDRLTTQSAMVTEPAWEALADLLRELPSPVYVVPQAVMNGVTGFNLHRGCLALGVRPPERAWDEVAAAARRVVVLERVGNADNVGVVFRNAAALGAGAVLLGPGCADPLYRKAIRTSMGATLSVPYAHVDVTWPSALHALRAAGFTLAGLTPRPDAFPLASVASGTARARLAVLVGHEGDGLSGAAMDVCDHLVRIPMASGIDSLNVAAATAIALYAWYDAGPSVPQPDE